MLELQRFNLLKIDEWFLFKRLFTDYLTEICRGKELQEELDDLNNEVLNHQMIEQTLQKQNPYFIMQILLDNACIGFISYSINEKRCYGFINNFYINHTHRNKGIGSKAYKMAEEHMKELGVSFIELNPINNAKLFYVRNGFTPSRKTADNETIYGKQV